jgi:RimJ/RimL family protein N-acetyltransferase
MIITETERLILREFTIGDLDDMAALFADPEVMRFSLGTKSREQTERWIRGCQEDYSPERWGFGLWAVVLEQSSDLIGFCGLSRFDDIDGQPEVEVGYRLARRFWGQGLATEAALATRDYAFQTLGLTRLISIIEPANSASVRVAEKTGMTLEKELVKWDRPVSIYVIHNPATA